MYFTMTLCRPKLQWDLLYICEKNTLLHVGCIKSKTCLHAHLYIPGHQCIFGQDPVYDLCFSQIPGPSREDTLLSTCRIQDYLALPTGSCELGKVSSIILLQLNLRNCYQKPKIFAALSALYSPNPILNSTVLSTASSLVFFKNIKML